MIAKHAISSEKMSPVVINSKRGKERERGERERDDRHTSAGREGKSDDRGK